MNQPFELHFIVEETPQGLLEAMLVELRIVVSGADDAELLEELAHALESHYDLAVEQGKPPFVGLCRPTSHGLYQLPVFTEMGTTPLRREVALALATAIHATSADAVHVKRLKKAA